MRLLTFVATVAAVAACGRSASGPGSTTPITEPPITSTRTDTVFVDEFDGAAIDRAKWEVYTGQVYNNEVQEYVDDTATMRIVHGAAAEGASGGALLIQARHRPGAKAAGARSDFSSGRLHGRRTFSQGRISARMKLPPGSGLWPAFWLLGASAWPAAGEIDIMENVGDSTWVNAAVHGPGYSGNTPFAQRVTLTPATDVTSWHVYEARWTPLFVSFHVDGAEYYRVEHAAISNYGPSAAITDSAKYVILNLALGGGYPAAVNGVSTPYLGLPQSTVDRIGRGEARVLVDWVRWTQTRPQ